MQSYEPGDIVCIAVPPQERLSNVLRMATTAVSGRIGLNIDQADDLNTAIDELFRLFISRHPSPESQFCIEYHFMEDRLEVLAEKCASLADQTESVGRYSRFLLESLADKLEERENPKGGQDVVLVKIRSEN